MNNNQLIILIFGLLYFSFIVYTRRRGNFDEFSVAGKSLGLFLIFSSICASYIGPGSTMGLTREGYLHGMLMAYIVPFGGLGMILSGIFFASKVRARFLTSYSIGDIVGGPLSHDHKLIRLAVGIISLLFLSSITVAMSYAGGELINNVFGFSKIWSIVIITSIVVVYSYFGGIRATIQTDAIQFIHFVILIPILALLIVLNADFSWQEYKELVAQKTTAALDAHPIAMILGMLMLWLLSTGLDSTGLSRFLASKSKKVARNAAIMAGVFMGIWFILMIFIGSTGAYLYPDLADNDQILLHIASNHFPGIIYGIFIIAMIGVVMSSQDTLLNIASVIFSEDILSAIIPSFSDQQKLIYAKIYTVILGILAIIIASSLSSVLGTILMVTEYYVPMMIPVTIFSILKNKHYWQSALVAMISGLLSYIIWANIGNEIVPTLLVSILISTLSYLISDLYIKNKRNNNAKIF